MDLDKNIINFKTEIELKNVSFTYENNKKKILDRINLKIKKNSKIAIVGKSGSGKTTIVDIIIGLLKPSEGYLLIDGIKLSQLPNWNRKIGYIPQNFYLFDESIKRNVAFGINEKNINIDKVNKAIEFAQLRDFVKSLDNGIETVVGNQGIMLSGGQKQRIIIARAAYNDPDILILDEATSAIDEEVEKEFINNLLKIGKNKTIIIISHRSTTIKNCDKIFKIEDGKLNEIKKEKIKLNIGSGSRPLRSYTNIDFDTILKLKKRYPNKKFNKKLVIKNLNVFKLPYKDSSVDEIRAEAFIEHLSFIEEKKFFYEVKRILKSNGKINFSTIDFEKTILKWLKIKDDWKDFYDTSKKAILEKHWFGTFSYDYENRWGYIVASIFGSQNGKGQYHKNCYSKKKINSNL